MFWEVMFLLWFSIYSLLLRNNGYDKIINQELELKLSSIIGFSGLKYITIIMNMFLWTLFQNWLGLFGYTGGGNTGFLFCNLSMSMFIFIFITYRGFEIRSRGYFDVIIPKNAPGWIIPFMILIEFISYCSRIISLCIRLTANIFGGHILTGIICNFLSYMRDMVTIIGFFLLILLTLLEISIGFLQSYVYVILFIIYLKDIYHAH